MCISLFPPFLPQTQSSSGQSDGGEASDRASARFAVQHVDGGGGGVRGAPQCVGQTGGAALSQDDGRGELHSEGPRGKSQEEELSERPR